MPNTIGGYLRRDNFLKNSFWPILKRAGLDIRFHDLRHTTATLLLAAGVNPKVVAERLGHSNIKITLDTYAHVLPTMQTESVQFISNMLFGSEMVKQYMSSRGRKEKLLDKPNLSR